MYKKNGFGIHCDKDVVLELGNKATVYNWLHICTTTTAACGLLPVAVTPHMNTLIDQIHLQVDDFPEHVIPRLFSRAGKDSSIYCLTLWSTAVASR